MPDPNKRYQTSDYIRKRRQLSGFWFEIALPNEYLVQVGRRDVRPILGGKRFNWFKKFIRVPASVQTLVFSTDNANVDYQGIGIEGFASWRINPADPRIALRALDFFDDNDPMARTNEELRTICVEAVRHVIANMTIDDALKKKDEIAANLKAQLQEVEKKWGIVFDQVGIEKVRIMSDRLFESLQARFRDEMRLETETKRIATDRDIAREENQLKERVELERLETARKIELSQVENESRVKETALDEAKRVADKQREIDAEAFRKDAAFRAEKEQKEHELSQLANELELKLLDTEKLLLAQKKTAEALRAEIERGQLELDRVRREISQSFTTAALQQEFLEKLPEVFGKIRIEHYNVLDGGGESVSPIGRFLGELAAIAQTVDFGKMFEAKGEAPARQSGVPVKQAKDGEGK